ncbi:hypothetical protein F5888DRAFT_509998 [Russula emetica]|nr:hypothetical protein F5888DRAFT_509998 [Russula emetica]
MRLFSVLPVLGLLLGTRASSHDSREPAPYRLDVRSPIIDIDVCVTLNADLVVPNLLNTLTAVGAIDACICLSALPVFLETNVVAALAVTIAGKDVVSGILTALINNQAAQSTCVYPEHSKPACVGGNPCGFTCSDGFTASLDSNPPACVCAPPSVLCNGKCKKDGPCPSARASTDNKRRWAGHGSGSCSEKGLGWAACGVYGGGSRAWECVNTARDLESCGGCTIPLTPYSPIGKDCSALPGVADVACLYGECVVFRCLPGYGPARDGHSCVRKYSQFDDAEDVPASAYGLEHVPLGRH